MPPIPFMPTIPYKNKCEVTAEDIAVPAVPVQVVKKDRMLGE
jgi:hypothetical protein